MYMPWGGDQYGAPDYEKYKAEKFEKTKQKILQQLKGIGDTSLNKEDQHKLVEQIKIIVASYIHY